jgi:beta-lactamase superfamily II metal-dependent hydrolase
MHMKQDTTPEKSKSQPKRGYRKFIWTIVLGAVALTATYIVAHRIYLLKPCTLVAFKLQKGHATLIDAPGTVVVVDGGGSAEILRQVGAELSIFDRAIDLAILSSVDKNKAAGLIELATRYKIHTLIIPATARSTSTKELLQLEQIASKNGIPIFYAQAPIDFDLSKDSSRNFSEFKISIVDPTVAYIPSKKENPTSVVSASCGSNSILVFGNATKRMQKFVTERIATSDTENNHYDVLLYQVTDAAANFYSSALSVFTPTKFIYSKRLSSKSPSSSKQNKSEPSLAQILGPANVWNIAQGTVRLEFPEL